MKRRLLKNAFTICLVICLLCCSVTSPIVNISGTVVPVPIEVPSSSGTIYTCAGNPVSVLIFEYDPFETNQSLYAASIAACSEEHPNAVRIGEPCWYYNCHSYAWHDNTSVWTTWPSYFKTDGCYEVTNIQVGDILVYTGDGHSAIVTEVAGNSWDQITVQSKWDIHGIYEHKVTDCPYTSTSITAYRMCTHSTKNCVQYNAYQHKFDCVNCNIDSYGTHVYNRTNICTMCGYLGSDVPEINKIEEESLIK